MWKFLLFVMNIGSWWWPRWQLSAVNSINIHSWCKVRVVLGWLPPLLRDINLCLTLSGSLYILLYQKKRWIFFFLSISGVIPITSTSCWTSETKANHSTNQWMDLVRWLLDVSRGSRHHVWFSGSCPPQIPKVCLWYKTWVTEQRRSLPEHNPTFHLLMWRYSSFSRE